MTIFKVINDQYGHDVGDDVINEVVRVLNHNTRADDRLFRLGGDEFFCFCFMASINIQ
ncbi:diguanylate cyclase [Vibrio sinaloensis]|nr:diguanylate cyclase [Vibrio sinaloensis]